MICRICDDIERCNSNISNDILKIKNRIKEIKMSYLNDQKVLLLKKENEGLLNVKKQQMKQLEGIDINIKEINTAIKTILKRLDLDNTSLGKCDQSTDDYLIKAIVLLKDVIQ